MSDDELNQVAGGSSTETSEDSKLLYQCGLIDDWHGEDHTMWIWHSSSKAVDEGWAKAGITCVTKWADPEHNLYFKDGKEISRSEAHEYLLKNFLPTATKAQ
ncbi:MAG: hypothetical protein J5809_08005 [Selenomonadaceae bacterium]|nr:hypothetical protein [Selenomonadaceae bacterium]